MRKHPFAAEAKLAKLKDLLQKEGFFDHADRRLLLFTEFKDLGVNLRHLAAIRWREAGLSRRKYLMR